MRRFLSLVRCPVSGVRLIEAQKVSERVLSASDRGGATPRRPVAPGCPGPPSLLPLASFPHTGSARASLRPTLHTRGRSANSREDAASSASGLEDTTGGGPSPYGPSSYGPTPYGPTPYGPNLYGPTSYGLPQHGLTQHGLTSSHDPR